MLHPCPSGCGKTSSSSYSSTPVTSAVPYDICRPDHSVLTLQLPVTASVREVMAALAREDGWIKGQVLVKVNSAGGELCFWMDPQGGYTQIHVQIPKLGSLSPITFINVSKDILWEVCHIYSDCFTWSAQEPELWNLLPAFDSSPFSSPAVYPGARHFVNLCAQFYHL